MFDHSIKVPRLYKAAAKIIQKVKEGDGSVKQLVYEIKHTNIKALYALAVETLQKSNEIDKLLKRCKLLEKEPRFDPWLARILIYELLWGKKRLPGESKPVKTILAYEQTFKAHISDVSLDSTEKNVNSQVLKPRYVRINTLQLSVNDAVDAFRHEDWFLSKFLDKNYENFLNHISSLQPGEFMVDIHIPSLLIFPPKTEFYKHPAYKSGSILLQDKASCLPVHILNPPEGSVVLDMCAAPGMKTTQIAATLNNKGTVFAIERDQRRFEILTKMVEKSGATCVKTLNKDVLTLFGADFDEVEYILVDPSCSGSGMVDRLEFEEKEDKLRLGKLAGFQIKILRHALTKFPKAKRVVYSTCSIYSEENEDVVRQVLETNSLFKLVPALPFVNNVWQNLGSPDYGDIGKCCLYAKPEYDLSNGFFVAVFERLEEGESNQFFNTNVYNIKKEEENKKKRKKSSEGHNFKQQGKKKETGFWDQFAVVNHGENFKNEGREEQINEETYNNTNNNVELNDFEKQENENQIKKKNKKSKKLTEENDEPDDTNVVESEEPVKKKKKKNKTHTENIDEFTEKTGQDEIEIGGEPIKKKKKSKKVTDVNEDIGSVEKNEENKKYESNTKQDCDIRENKKKKKKSKDYNDDNDDFTYNKDLQDESKRKNKKQKNVNKDIPDTSEIASQSSEEMKTKKKKHKRNMFEENTIEEVYPIEESSAAKRKKKKKDLQLIQDDIGDDVHSKKKKRKQADDQNV